MNTIKFKIKRYDDETNSIIVAFSSDETATNNPDDYQEFAFQPTVQYPDITNMEVLKKRIAEQGMAIADMAKKIEDAKSNTTMQNNWKALVGQTFEYETSVLTSADVEVNYTNEIHLPEAQ